MARIVIVQGGQWGSEGKGMVAGSLCIRRNVDIAVRTGAVNAGHTVYYKGQPFVCQQIPVGWVNPNTKLVIGAGAFIFPEILAKEIQMINEATGADCRDRLFIDYRASLHLPKHQAQAKLEDRHHAIGATGKGCSVAITDKIRYRGKGYRLFKAWLDNNRAEAYLTHLQLVDTVEMLHSAYDQGALILLEGTQGSLLDLHLGPYPYTTHKQTQAAQWVVEAGLAPNMWYEVVMVARAFPIRVAGNSGPMPLETNWCSLIRMMNKRLEICGMPPRVSEQSVRQFEEARIRMANLHFPSLSSLNFWQYSPEGREQHKVAISELDKLALEVLPPDTLADLRKVMEMTTVTKKLRRVAHLDWDTLRWSCRVNRADSVVLTFFNHWFPELWGTSSVLAGRNNEYLEQVTKVERALKLPLSAITTGPDDCHFMPLDAGIGVGQ